MNLGRVRFPALSGLLPLLVGCASIPEKGGFDDVQRLAGAPLEQRLHWRQQAENSAPPIQTANCLITYRLNEGCSLSPWPANS